jgi:hypothetical protein
MHGEPLEREQMSSLSRVLGPRDVVAPVLASVERCSPPSERVSSPKVADEPDDESRVGCAAELGGELLRGGFVDDPAWDHPGLVVPSRERRSHGGEGGGD